MMAIDFSKIEYVDDPEWLDRITTANGRDDGEVMAISLEFLDKAHAGTNGKPRRSAPATGKELLESMLRK